MNVMSAENQIKILHCINVLNAMNIFAKIVFLYLYVILVKQKNLDDECE